MADKPAEGGGGGLFNGHDPFVLIIAGMLLLTLIVNIGNKGKSIQLFNPGGNTVSTAAKDTRLPEPPCGLTVGEPRPLTQVKNEVLVSGRVGMCEWQPVGDVGLYVQVVDGSGKPISDYTAITLPRTKTGPDTWAIFDYSFGKTILLTEKPTTKNGTVIFVNPDRTQATTKTYRVPIQFTP